jgi:AraC-like DNA-binding protein
MSRDGGLARWQRNRTLTYIEDNLGSRLTVADLARTLRLSQSHFSRGFKRSLGLTPMVYVRTRRVELAKLLMVSSRDQLSVIALTCGFVDQAHLCRSFRRLVGVSPALWRRHSRLEAAVGAELFRRAGIAALRSLNVHQGAMDPA